LLARPQALHERASELADSNGFVSSSIGPPIHDAWLVALCSAEVKRRMIITTSRHAGSTEQKEMEEFGVRIASRARICVTAIDR
jgi:hypothetical protein